jgi:NarL family two-component system sensor histidine kinase YdfH
MNRHPTANTVRVLPWFFLVWLLIVYLWGVLGIVLKGWIQIFPKSGLGARFCGIMPQNSEGCVSFVQLGRAAGVKLPVLVAFTFFLIGFGILLWMNLSKTHHRRCYWLSFPIQGVLVLITAVVVSEVEMALVLTLLLSLETIFIFKQASLVFVVSCSAVILFILIILVTPPQGSAFWFPPSWNLFGPIGTWSFLGLVALLLFVIGYLVLYVQWIRAHAQLEAAHRELEATHKELVAASSRITVLTRLTERQRLARDLHDTLAQGLAGLVMQLQVADSYQTEHHFEHAQAIIQQAILRARTTLAEARQTIDELRHASIRTNELEQAVHEEIEHFTNLTGIPCEVELSMLSVIPSELGEHVLRMIGEGLSNVARHACARAVWIGATRCENSVQLELRDNGIGFDPATVGQSSGHYGLLGLRERAKLCRGQLEIVSAAGVGTRLRLSLPTTGEEVSRDEDNPCRDCG